MPIKNYTTKASAAQTVGEIQGKLAMNGARKVMMDYSEDGRVESVSFMLHTPQGPRGFVLPANIEAMAKVLERQRVRCDIDHAERVAWRNIKDWIDAQMALMETEQVSMEQIFLPFMADNQGRTVYELYASSQLALGDGGVT